MNYNIFLLRLGFDPSQFVNHLNEPIKIDDGWIYEVEQINPVRQCPHCKHHVLYIHSRRQVDFNCRETQHINDVLRVWRIRLRCSKCRKPLHLPSAELIGVIQRANKHCNSFIVTLPVI